MEDREMWFWIIGALCLGSLLTFTAMKSVPDTYEQPRTEVKKMNCEIWEVCDYRQMIGCLNLNGCGYKYSCYTEMRNCTLGDRDDDTKK